MPPKFFNLLQEQKIDLLADVRINPLSRKPGFSKSALIRECGVNGIEYRHFAGLGCPRPILLDYRSDKDWDEYSRRFWQHLKSGDLAVELALQEVELLASESRVALLCFEADFQFCHRSYVAEELSQRMEETEIGHITSQGLIEARPKILADILTR